MKFLAMKSMQLAYLEEGTGPPVVFVHCSSASHKEWLFAVKQMVEDYRVLVPDLLGYGASSPWPTAPFQALDTDLDALESLIQQAGGPVHLVGHSYGAAICLEAARRDALNGTGRVDSLCLIEPVSFHLLRGSAYQKEWSTISAVAGRVIDLCDRERIRSAAAVYMGFWIGWLKWMLSPKRFRREVMRTMRKVSAEFQGVFDTKWIPEDYQVIRCPVTLVQGGRSPAPARAVIRILRDILPNQKWREIAQAGHMSPFTHRTDVAGVIAGHLKELRPDGHTCPRQGRPAATNL